MLHQLQPMITDSSHSGAGAQSAFSSESPSMGEDKALAPQGPAMLPLLLRSLYHWGLRKSHCFCRGNLQLRSQSQSIESQSQRWPTHQTNFLLISPRSSGYGIPSWLTPCSLGSLGFKTRSHENQRRHSHPKKIDDHPAQQAPPILEADQNFPFGCKQSSCSGQILGPIEASSGKFRVIYAFATCWDLHVCL